MRLFDFYLLRHTSCYTTLGKVRMLQGCTGNQEALREAEGLFRKALDIRSKVLGINEDTAISLHNYAAVLKQRANVTDAM